MILRCRRCRWSWGPIGVRPWLPGGPEQLFLLCEGCGAPQALLLDPGAPGSSPRCGPCGSDRLVPLTRCPACGADEPRWGPLGP
jgi:hypothetical protein